MMQKTLNQLLKIQIIIIVIMLILVVISPFRSLVVGFGAGGVLCLLPTLSAKRIFKRVPEGISGKKFFQVMIIVEIVKWLITLIAGAFLVRYTQQPIGVVIGFALTYFSYFLMILKV